MSLFIVLKREFYDNYCLKLNGFCLLQSEKLYQIGRIPFGEEKHMKVSRAAPLWLFQTILKEWNSRTFVSEEQLDQALKISFLCSPLAVGY